MEGKRMKEGGMEGSCPLHWKTLHIRSFLAIYLALFYLVFLYSCAAIPHPAHSHIRVTSCVMNTLIC